MLAATPSTKPEAPTRQAKHEPTEHACQTFLRDACRVHGDVAHLEAVQRHEQSEDIVGSLKDPEDSQVPHHSLCARVL